MSNRTNLVNLDAMIKREDFATEASEQSTFENVSTISLRDFTKGGLIGPNLRKPDFQRETNHWSPGQVVSLLECFVNGDLIPSVILWQSSLYLFVIDGGHRLSALRAWVEDDYGDGHISQAFFGYQISREQRIVAEKTRSLVNKTVGSFKHYQAKLEDDCLETGERQRLNTVVSRGLPIQWVKGDANKAESSFFKINTKGTPLDEIEELLLKSRKKPISIAARAVIRAGKGHRYWSSFSKETAAEIESLAKQLHVTLFDPEIKTPVKTLDLPLGGSKGVRTALQVLIEYMLVSNRDQAGVPKDINSQPDDRDGSETITSLRRSIKLANRITGNDGGSLGLHPAVYFYGPTGRHSSPLFMGTVDLLAKKLVNNDPSFFTKFTSIRAQLEDVLITHKDLIATIMQKHISPKRVGKYVDLLDGVINKLLKGEAVTEATLVDLSGLDGKVVVGSVGSESRSFSDDAKSQAFIRLALDAAIKCPICGGYIDPAKSVSYDHIVRVRESGKGSFSNCQLSHPYCNQSVKQ